MSKSKTSSKGSVNKSAVIALVLAVFQLNVIAFFVGFLALKRINLEGQRGRGLAIAAIALGAVQTLFLVWVISNPSGAGQVLGTIWGNILNLLGVEN
jgi:hypothetical protein